MKPYLTSMQNLHVWKALKPIIPRIKIKSISSKRMTYIDTMKIKSTIFRKVDRLLCMALFSTALLARGNHHPIR
jgi:hypothetical protein